MRGLLTVLGVCLLLAGSVWLLQGLNVLPGSFMSGQTRWAVNGAIAIGAGLVLLIALYRPRRPTSP